MPAKLIVVYQPHQNIRQHEASVQTGYENCFALADKVYWLPTYLSREDPNLEVLEPAEILKIAKLSEPKFEIANLDKNLAAKIQFYRQNGDLVILLGAGSIDAWARQNLLQK